MFDEYQNYIPPVSHRNVADIAPLASFIARRFCSLQKTLLTSTDQDEKIETIAAMISLQSSLSLLSLAFFTEQQELIDKAKEIYRSLQT